MSDFVLIDRQDQCVTLTFNRPAERNAIGSRLDCDQLVSALEQINADSSVSVVILTGAGSSFCAGGNLKKMREQGDFTRGANPATTAANFRQGIQHMAKTLWRLEVPVIAAVNGPAIGLGCDIACMCDMRIAAAGALFAHSLVWIWRPWF